ncbi:MAG TPA: alpha/beta fold hydrolase [Gaiellaceae bacterium]|nr:alpha/beta fold hydrolase [Gaiellaceae bacterium]
MARFVLVHGAWHGAWCFVELVRELEMRGHAAAAVDLPCDQPGLDQHDYARLIGPQPDAIVVGHSLAAQTIPHVLARTRVYLAGLLPVAGSYAEAFVERFGGFVRDELDRSYWPDADTCAAFMYPDCTRERSDWAFSQLRPQARIAEETAPFGAGDVVIATRHDAAIDGTWQARTGRKRGAHVIELDSGHSPFFTQPGDLADVLASLA